MATVPDSFSAHGIYLSKKWTWIYFSLPPNRWMGAKQRLCCDGLSQDSAYSGEGVTCSTCAKSCHTSITESLKVLKHTASHTPWIQQHRVTIEGKIYGLLGKTVLLVWSNSTLNSHQSSLIHVAYNASWLFRPRYMQKCTLTASPSTFIHVWDGHPLPFCSLDSIVLHGFFNSLFSYPQNVFHDHVGIWWCFNPLSTRPHQNVVYM